MPPAGGDHPRSRGVYPRATCACASPCGSSPLARGLQLPVGEEQRHVRIIPARAGFTWCGRARRLAGRDHPRSRGVYAYLDASDPDAWGSSPLARGLRVDRLQDQTAQRIIPARAGFTMTTRAGRRRPTDHPRSRGVYGGVEGGHECGEGSSPLARGLPDGSLGRGHRLGIIPARAGFTRTRSTPTTRAEDHPRSRGVYRPGPRHRRHRRGSSPLARGLHLRILGIPTNPYSTRPRLPSLPT